MIGDATPTLLEELQELRRTFVEVRALIDDGRRMGKHLAEAIINLVDDQTLEIDARLAALDARLEAMAARLPLAGTAVVHD
jgi:hypothetical protein